jgi:hypothetical protein
MTTLARARDFGTDTLSLAWERKKTVLAVIGGVTLLSVGGVFIARFLRGRAHALASKVGTADTGGLDMSFKTNKGKNGSAASLAKAGPA